MPGSSFFNYIPDHDLGKVVNSTHEDFIHGIARSTGVDAKPGSCIRLGIAVNNQYFSPGLLTKAGNIQTGCCLACSTFMVRKSNDCNFTTLIKLDFRYRSYNNYCL